MTPVPKKKVRTRPKVKGSKSASSSEAASPLDADSADDDLHALLARRVRDARARRFMTRKQLAEQSGISMAYLARVEGGTSNISLGLLKKLAHALSMPIASFLSADEPASADLALIVAFLKRQPIDKLAQIRRRLFEGRDARRIALIGIRGVGKSTLGPKLAQRLKVPFVELNDEIEKEANLNASEILSLYGQRRYRMIERGCLERIAVDHPQVVLATGGGIVAEAGTYQLLLTSFFTIWLTAKPDAMFERVLAQHDARIASEHMRVEAINNITRTLEARKQFYELAHASYDTTGREVDRIIGDLVELLPDTSSPDEIPPHVSAWDPSA